jgi:hypothetical protein
MFKFCTLLRVGTERTEHPSPCQQDVIQYKVNSQAKLISDIPTAPDTHIPNQSFPENSRSRTGTKRMRSSPIIKEYFAPVTHSCIDGASEIFDAL